MRALFPAAQVLIRADETELPMVAEQADQAGAGERRAVFLGRIVPVKGLDILLRSLRQFDSPITLDIIGTEEDSVYTALCKRLVAEVSPEVNVNLCGPIPHEEVREIVRSYDLMVLPTLGENFGHVIAEALSCGIPVFCSENTPWTSVLRNGGGGVVSPNSPGPWRALLKQLTSLTDEEFRTLKDHAARAYNDWRASQVDAHIFTKLRIRVTKSD